MSSGVSPSRKRLAKAVRAQRRRCPPIPAEALVKSSKCWGRSPSGPPAEPLGKERIACATAPSLTTKAPSSSWLSGGGGMLESGCGAGCFDLKAAIVDSFASATESSEQAKRTAPLKSPSSNYTETLVAKDSKGSYCRFFVDS